MGFNSGFKGLSIVLALAFKKIGQTAHTTARLQIAI